MIYKKFWKYILINTGTPYYYFPKALKNFGDVKKEDTGGYVANYHNLSQKGNCWVYKGASVTGNARITENARVFGNAIVYGNAIIKDNAEVSGYSIVKNNAIVCDNAQVKGQSCISGKTIISGNTIIDEDSEIYNNHIR